MSDTEMEGTIFNLEDEGSWFTFFTSRVQDDGTVKYDEPLDGAGRVCIRTVNSFIDSQHEKQKRKAEFVFNPKTRGMERIEYKAEMTAAERKAFLIDLWDFAIMDWEKFFDAKKVEIPCNKETKARMMQVPVFDRFMSRCLQLLEENAVSVSAALDENL